MVERSTNAGGPGGRIVPVTMSVFVMAAALIASMTVVAVAQPSPSPAPETPATTMLAVTPAPVTSAPAAATSAPANGTILWEYRTLFVTWDSAAGSWVADFSDGNRLVGLDPILNAEGQNGWELVAVVPELWTQVVDDAIREDARRLRLFLKKPRG